MLSFLNVVYISHTFPILQELIYIDEAIYMKLNPGNIF